MESDSISLIIIIVCIVMSAYFSATETAFSSLNKIRIKNMAEKGNKKAALVMKLSESYDSLLSTILIGNNIVNILSASLATVLFVKILGDEAGTSVSTAVGLQGAAFVLFGQNIGTCITAFLASVGTSRNAKRTTLIHIMFNVFGTVVFTILCLATPIILMVEGWTPGNAPAQIANMHTMFNVVTTLLLLPVGTLLGKLATAILKDKREESEGMRVKYLLDIKHINTEKLGASVICMEGIKKELIRMMDMTKDNVSEAFDAVIERNKEKYVLVEQQEEYVDFLNKEISKYITSTVSHETTKAGSQIFNSLFSITSNIERISDHAINIAGYSKMITDKSIVFSEDANSELIEMQVVCMKLFTTLLKKPEDVVVWHEKIACMEQKIDDMTVQFRDNMYARIRSGKCSDEGSILFSEILTDFERIGDHALNIANDILNMEIAGK